MKRREREYAERLYVEGQLTLDEITEKLKQEKREVGRRTVGNWCPKHDWENKRQAYLQAQSGDAESLQRIIRALEDGIAADQKKKIAISPGRQFALTNLRAELARTRREAKREEDAPPEEGKKPPLSPENFLKIEREEFGFHANDNRRKK